jgi:hypothetical protein
MKGLLVGISNMETSESAFLAAIALLSLALWPRLKGILAACGCFVIDQALQWRRFDAECMTKPIHMWLLGAYVFAMMCYMSCDTVTKQCKLATPDVSCVPQTSGKSGSKVALAFAAVLPMCLFAWSGLGIYWLDDVLGSETPCVPNDGHQSTTFVVTCLILLGLEAFLCAVISGQAWAVSQSVARGSAAVMAITDADFVQRWGVPKPILQEDLRRGLSPAQIDSLPCGQGSASGESCVICLCPVEWGERVRKLPSCSHSFHRCCVDQWLLRCASCPTCKAAVVLE